MEGVGVWPPALTLSRVQGETMTIAAAHPESAGDGSVRIGTSGPTIGIVLPRHAIGAEGSDALDWVAQTTTDGYEIETEYVSGPLRAVVQHDGGESSWRIRASLANPSDNPVSVSTALLAVHPGDGQAWVWAAGSAGLVVLVTRDGDLWAFSLKHGTLTRQAGDVVSLD